MPAENQAKERLRDSQAAQEALALLADRWSFAIVREIYAGVHRFGQLQRGLGIARNILASRLAKLVEHGLLEKVRYRTEPDWYEYRLTARGNDLYPTILSFFRWAETSYSHAGRPPKRLRHSGCGKLMQPVLVCSECSQPLATGEVEALD